MYRIERRPGRYSGSGLERLRKILEVPKNPGPYTLDDVEAWLER
jgi:hypothetical protein